MIDPASPMCVVSDAVQHGKPSPNIYAAALERYRAAIDLGSGAADGNDDGPADSELAAACVFVDNQVSACTTPQTH